MTDKFEPEIVREPPPAVAPPYLVRHAPQLQLCELLRQPDPRRRGRQVYRKPPLTR